MILLLSFLGFVALLAFLLLKPYFSPLKNLPTPAKWPIIGHTHYFLKAKDFIDLYTGWCYQYKNERMFSVKSFLMANDMVVLTHPDDAKKILSRPDIMLRGKLLKKYFPLTGNGLFNSTGQDHVFQKTLLAKAFSIMHLKYYLPVFQKHTEELCKIWLELVKAHTNGKNIQVQEYLDNFAFDVVGEISFGYKFNSQTSKNNPFVQKLKLHAKGLTNLYIRMLLELFPFLMRLPFGPAALLEESNKEARKNINQIFQARVEKLKNGQLTEQEKHDMLSLMIEARDEDTKKGLSDQVIQDLSFTFLIAAFDTTSISLSWVLLNLAKRQELQKKARDEIMENLKDLNNITIEEMDKLPFTNSFLKEVLRLQPAAPFTLRISQKEYELNGQVFPKGTAFLMPLFFYNLENFDNDINFEGERFLKHDTSGFIFTFGYGPYSCIGKNFALLEMKVAMISIIRHFEISVDPEFENYNRTTNLATTKTDKPITLRLKKVV